MYVKFKQNNLFRSLSESEGIGSNLIYKNLGECNLGFMLWCETL